MPDMELYLGDCPEVMSKRIPDESVQCCVTSPPYYGLRDYQTGKWEGGDPKCTHQKITDKSKAVASSTLGGGKATTGHIQEGYRSICGRCGAVRVDAQIGLEDTPEQYVERLVEVFREVRRVLKDDGTVFLNLGDSYNGSGGAGGDYSKGGLKEGQPKYPGRKIDGLKPKDLIGIPWMVAFALRADGWYLRQDLIWAKPNPMPESVADRCTKAHEYIFLLSKSAKYYYDADAIAERSSHELWPKMGGSTHAARRAIISGGDTKPMTPTITRNKRSVWVVASEPTPDAHFATYPTKLIEPCILAGSRPGDIVLDPFNGSGTTGYVALKHGRKYIGIDLNEEYLNLANRRLLQVSSQRTIFDEIATVLQPEQAPLFEVA